MPATKRPKPLYRRGQFGLYPRDGRNLEIVWYDAERKRERSASAGTSDPEAGKLALDRLFLASDGARHCPTCGRPWEGESPLLADVIADYLILADGKAGEAATKTRLGHVARYLGARHPTATVLHADEAWVERFRKWMLAETIRGGQRGAVERNRSLGAVEGCVLQLAAAINSTPGQRANFRPIQMTVVSRSPKYRADIPTIAAMFDYCLRPDLADTEHHLNPGVPNEKLVALRIKERENLLRYLRAAVATWARPDAIYDIAKPQWHSNARVLELNPPNRRQTRKYRPAIAVAHQLAPHLDELEGRYIDASSIRGAWDRMAAKLSLPGNGEAGEKLIRRSIATIVRRAIGEANWIQGQMMLGHVKASTSDIYAIPDPANLGLALAATEAIIDQIEVLSPGAYRTVTALKIVNGDKK